MPGIPRGVPLRVYMPVYHGVYLSGVLMVVYHGVYLSGVLRWYTQGGRGVTPRYTQGGRGVTHRVYPG